jgi:hypothetical protein
MLTLGGLSVAVSLILAAISLFSLSSLCILCLATYTINLVLLGLAWRAVRREGWSRTFHATSDLQRARDFNGDGLHGEMPEWSRAGVLGLPPPGRHTSVSPKTASGLEAVAEEVYRDQVA